MTSEPFRRLVRLVARAFYDDEIPHKGANPGKSGKSDNKGISVVVLDALTRRQWVKEEELAKRLKLHPKQLRRTLRVLEDEMLVIREDHKETTKNAKVYNAAVAVADGEQQGGPANEKTKALLHSYCCLDYAQICDVVRYRIHRAKKMIKDELEDKNTVQEYVCPDSGCGRRYSALDASRLISPVDMNFHCERCDAELVANNDKLAPKDLGEGNNEENARRRQREKLKEMLERMEVQLKPLTDQLAKLKDLTPPDYGSFSQWQERTLAQARGDGDGDHKTANGERPSVPMPFLGETKVEVAFAGSDTKEAVKEDPGKSMKVLPPWMIRQGMSLTAQQRGEVKTEEGASSDTKPTVAATMDEKPMSAERQLQEEYVKAYYAALMLQQQQQQQQQQQPPGDALDEVKKEEPDQENGFAAIAGDRVVGAKSKRDDAEDDVEWEEEAPSTEAGVAGAADAGDDDIDWE
ncbi:general transcription factor IIE subunit 1 isoform X1 [Selaginella moellendorffii]|uniref:general transcription factor IIE subunit 1 isoform X1 n=2 Tax=Selaginella moellendorffii TaxID=88036 RepID=UPI000D1C458A|nr:general transcription factor IIE subunit 1 isoform X1 [Selaginella moellendorffii]|eukprot:XP_024543384.1 general transcription factor IIE subunit 1 isoform X1 [Selaginella moellendorffii]